MVLYICRKCLELNDKTNKCLLVWKVRKGAGWLTFGFLRGAVVYTKKGKGFLMQDLLYLLSLTSIYRSLFSVLEDEGGRKRKCDNKNLITIPG